MPLMSAPSPPPSSSCRLLFADSERCADMMYAAGTFVPDAFLWLECPKETLVVVSPMEIRRLKQSMAPGTTVLSRHEAAGRCGLDAAKPPPMPRLVGHLIQHSGCSTCQVPKDFPLFMADELRSQGIEVTVQTPFFPGRANKSRAEIEAVREGVQLAETGLRRALLLLHQAGFREDGTLSCPFDPSRSLTSEDLQGEINAEIARAGGTASHTIVAGGPQGADCHQPGYGPLRAGEPIVIDIFPRVNRSGYNGDLTRTVVKGCAPPQVRKAFQAVRQAQAAAIAAAEPGVPFREVHNTAANSIKEAGFLTDVKATPPRGFIHGTGHGLGLEVHEAPRVSDTDGALEVGHVVTIEPGIYEPQWGGIRLEDVIAITEDGAENLTSADIVLEIP